jgi:phosphate transport system substrate-binding protein
MAYTRGRCTNFDYCSIADRRQDVEVALGDDFVCPECGRPLKPPPAATQSSGNTMPLVLAGLGVVLVGGAIFGAVALFNQGGGSSKNGEAQNPPAQKPAMQTAAAAAPAAPLPQAALTAPAAAVTPATQPARAATPPAIPETVLLRLSGSNTVGAELGPKLAKAFLADSGDTDVTLQQTGKPDETNIAGMRDGKREVITVAAHGTATAFTDLAKGAADVGMASRRIKPAEAASLIAMGDLTSAAGEHVLALDGIAVIVNPSNSVPTLTKEQLRDIFNGTITDWSKLGAPAGPIHIYARDDKSGTFDTFKSLVLGSTKLAASAHRIEDSRELSGDVAGDAGGIGFIGLPYILSAKPVPVADTGATPLIPNRLTVGTEDYPLSRRLFLYTATQGGNPLSQRFAEFALSPAGQAIVEETGFIPLTIKPEQAPVPQTASARYRALIGHATRLSTNFRFQANSAALDNRGQRDLDRLVNFVLSAHAAPSQIILVGFADNKGSPSANLIVSKKRADAVATELAQHGVKVGHVVAFGSDLPVADNGSDEGREKNRRVEVYMQL